MRFLRRRDIFVGSLIAMLAMPSPVQAGKPDNKPAAKVNGKADPKAKVPDWAKAYGVRVRLDVVLVPDPPTPVPPGHVDPPQTIPPEPPVIVLPDTALGR